MTCSHNFSCYSPFKLPSESVVRSLHLRTPPCRPPRQPSPRRGAAAQREGLRAASLRFPKHLGRRPPGRRPKAGNRALFRSPSGSAEAPSRPSRPRDAPFGVSPAPQPTRVSHRMSRDSRRHVAKPRRLSRASLFGSVGSHSPRRRGERQALPVRRHAKSRHPHRPLRERPRSASWTALGRPLARPRAHDATPGPHRARVRAREFSKTLEKASTPRRRRFLVCSHVRRLARLSRRRAPATRWAAVS
jgi:hypothetical protein